jgi:MFS family permease
MQSGDRPAITSAWSPLRQPLFRALWIAAVASNIGTWMHSTAAAWLMTSLTPSPIMVAFMQTATSLPAFLLALPAGALADVVDRRRLLLATQGWMLAAAAALGLLTLVGAITPWVLLILTFLLGLGAAMNTPAWQAITPDLISRSELPAAVALSGVGINLARAVGPALGGLIVAAAGTGTVFLLNAASFVGVMVALYRWPSSLQQSALPAEHMLEAMRAGMRYVRHAPALNAILVRTAVFISCGSALWALLPLVARSEMELSAIGYGVLLGCLGLGAIAGTAILPKLQRRFVVDCLAAGATIVFAAATLALAYLRALVWLCPAMVAGGIAWTMLMSSLNTTAQLVLPAWVRARGLAMFMLVFMGGLALGSALWGAVSARAGSSVALAGAALGLVLGLTAVMRYRLASGEAIDLTPSMHWLEPGVVIEPRPEEGPVLVMIEYHIDPAHAHEFAAAMQAVRLERLRDGAIRWGLFRDPASPGRYVETFMAASWVEHLRQHARVTMADREAEARALAFHIGDGPPVVSHLVAEHLLT